MQFENRSGINEDGAFGRATVAHVDGANPATGAYNYYTHDHLGSTRALYNATKSLVATYAYTPYGQDYASPGTTGTTHRFTGHDWNPQSGLYFAPHRFYNPQLARWMSRDPLGMVDGPNVYAYVLGNPVSHFDPMGLKCEAEWAAVKATCGAAVLVAIGDVLSFWLLARCARKCILNPTPACIGVCIAATVIASIVTTAISTCVGRVCTDAIRDYGSCRRRNRR
jgi:RHS repeat-associated protein